MPPECGCIVHDDPPRGEVIVRSPGNMPGHAKNPEKTAAAIDEEGFFIQATLSNSMVMGHLLSSTAGTI